MVWGTVDPTDDSPASPADRVPSSCDDSAFKCRNGACVMKRWQCDGDNDCGDGSDEDPELCGKRRLGNSAAYTLDGFLQEKLIRNSFVGLFFVFVRWC